MAIIQDWKIRPTNARCELTGEAFEDGQEFYTCIFEDPNSDAFLRCDYAVPSWARVKGELDPPPYSFWKSTYKAPEQEERKPRIEDTSAEGMLRRFMEEDDPSTENARYILALMLERRKTLIPTDSKETETRKLLFYEHAENGDVFIVADPGLRLDEIETVQQEVSDLLAAEEAKASQPVDEQSQDDGDADEGQPDEGGDETAEPED